jgi:hypothetical protein
MANLIPEKFFISDDLGIKLGDGKEKLTFQGIYILLRNTLDIKYTRKLHIDSILKKCKGKFFKALYECLRKCIIINIPKFPQSFITNISTEYNKQFLDFTLKDLYQYFHLLPYSIDEFFEKKYCLKGKEIYFKYLVYSKLTNLYSQYLKSKNYKRTLELIKTKKGINICKLYQFASENFINYYLFSKAHIRKKTNSLSQENLNMEQSEDAKDTKGSNASQISKEDISEPSVLFLLKE